MSNNRPMTEEEIQEFELISRKFLALHDLCHEFEDKFLEKPEPTGSGCLNLLTIAVWTAIGFLAIALILMA